MPATKRYLNWTGTGFTPTAGALTPITGVTNVAFANNGNLLKFSGDGDRYPTTTVHDFTDPTITVTTADLAVVRTLAPGTRGVFVTIHNDAKNGIGSGAMTYTAQAIVQSNDTGGQHRQIGQGTLTFATESVDGITNPVASVVTA